MSEPEDPKPETNPAVPEGVDPKTLPKCPHCKALFTPMGIPYNTNRGDRLFMIFCDDCKAVINVLMLAQRKSPIAIN